MFKEFLSLMQKKGLKTDNYNAIRKILMSVI